MKNIKCIFFDIGYTLINEDDVWEQRCIEQAEMEEAKMLGVSNKQIYEEIIKASITYQPQYRTVVKKFGFFKSAPYRYELEKLYHNADLVLHSLSQRYKLGIIANQTDGLSERLNSWGISKYFSFIFSSWDYQIMKPDIKLFQIALEQSGYNASETVMVGDRLDNDIFPAKAIGMKTIWIKQGFGGMQNPKSEEYFPDTEITNLNELLNIL
jgi:haloacid dehalogenase superfamily, subfamily IA, variant 3 with third motif having DD or ED/haloacid dehalogenase superfamily, subfamily IA, variant 1 with third motif having Dx(3-4)D or Dx(3-4)E